MVIEAAIDGLTQDCSNVSALAMDLLQSCAKPSTLPVGSFEWDTSGYTGSVVCTE